MSKIVVKFGGSSLASASQIRKAVEIIRLQTRTEDNAIDPAKAVEYATPETMREDIRNYIESYYYREVINIIADETEAQLYVQTVSSKTDTTIEMLVGLRMDAYGDVDAAAKYETYVKSMLSDTELEALLNGMNDSLKGAYGDVGEALRNAYLKTFVTAVLGKDKAPSVAGKTREEIVADPEAEDGTKVVKISLKGEVAELVEAELAGVTFENIDDLIAKVEALHAAYELDEDYDVHNSSAQYVYYAYLNTLTSLETDSFYYDAQMAQMDAAVRAKVAEKKAAIEAALPAEFTVYELYAKIMAALADSEDSVYDFAEGLAANITHVAEGKYSIKDDIVTYFCYSLMNSFEGYDLSEAPKIGIPSNMNYTNAMVIVDDLLTKSKINPLIPNLLAQAKASAKRGEMPNYALTSFLTEEEINAYAYQMGEALGKAKFLNSKPEDAEALAQEINALLPDLRAYLEHVYYNQVIARLDADSKPTFHVSEVYGSTLYSSTMGLKNLMYYYTSTATGMSASEIEKIIGVTGDNLKEDDAEQEASRYLSDDGRIVSVTYGTKNADGSYTAYKTFILNYNNFSVTVDYGPTLATEEETEAAKVTYTIPAYGYVVVMH